MAVGYVNDISMRVKGERYDDTNSKGSRAGYCADERDRY